MPTVTRNIHKLKKIARISADRAAEMDLGTSPTRLARGRNHEGIAKLMLKHLDGVSALSQDFDALLRRSHAKVEAEAKKLRAQALKRARGRQPFLANMTAQYVAAAQALPEVVDVPSAKRHWLSTPFEVFGLGLNFDSFATVPFNSFAKFKTTWTKTAAPFYNAIHPEVLFRFAWENTSDKYVVININGFMVLHGYCDIWSDGGIFPGDRSASLMITPTMQLFDWTTEPYGPYVVLGSKEEAVAVEMHTNTGTTLADSDSEETDVFRGYDLSKTLLLVPPGTAVGVVMTAAMRVYAGKNSGRVRVDFSTGNYQVGTPGVLVTVVS